MALETAKPRSSRAGLDLTRLGVAVIVFAVVVSVMAIAFLAGSVQRKIDDLAAANSDTTQWSLAQTEVDLLALQLATHAVAANEGASLSDVRQRFDIFYSRVMTLAESRQFANLRKGEQAGAALEALTGFLERRVADFDGADAALRAALPAIEADLGALRDDIRSVSLLGLRQFAADADDRREGVAVLLARIGLLTFALVLTLLLFVVILLGMIRLSVRSERAAESARNRLRRVVSTSIDAILAVGHDGRIIDYNGAAERIFGYTRDEAIGRDMADLVIPDHLRAAHEAGMARYREGGPRRVVGAGLLHL